ncbi:putative T7SS-secreted protein [Streptomyces sp. SYSU K217416]
MGWRDLANSGLGALEDGIDVGKKIVGTGIDIGTDVGGEALRAAGADGVADTVEDAGDYLATNLGAEVGEQQLGQTEQANELIHGSPTAIRESAKHLKDFFGAFDRVGQGMRALDSSHWKGEAATAFRDKFAMHPAKWMHAADACEAAGQALDAYADTVMWAQEKAQEAIDLYLQGREASQKAVAAYEDKADAYEAAAAAGKDPGPPLAAFRDPGESMQERAQEILAEVRRQRNTASETVQRVLDAALTHAPAERPPLDRAVDTFQDFNAAAGVELLHLGAGVVKGAGGMVNFARGLNPMDLHNIKNPAAFMENASMTLSGLVSTAAQPERALTQAWETFKKDPLEFAGRMLPEAVGPKGAGLAKRLAGRGRNAVDAAKAGPKGTARETIYDGSPVEYSRTAESVCQGGDPIDLATGKMFHPQVDVVLPGTLPLVFSRRVESGYRVGRWFGPSWSSTADQRLEIDSEGVIFVCEDGLLLSYPHPAPGVPTLPVAGPRWPMDRQPGGYAVADPVTGRAWHFTDQGEELARLEQIDDRNGNWITFEYDERGAPTSIVHSAGYHLKLTTGGLRILALHLADAGPDGSDQELLHYGYTGGHLTEVINSSGLPLRFAYDDAGRVTSWTDTNERHYEYVYDDHDRCIVQGGTEGHLKMRLAFDDTDPETGHRVTTAVDSLGHASRYVINDACQVVAEVDPFGATIRMSRDRYNRLLSRTDALGRTTAFEYDDTGNLVTVTRPDGHGSVASYNQLGLPTTMVAPDGAIWRQTYDERGNRTSVTDPSGATTRYTYDEAGRPTSVTDALGNITLVRCNRAGLPIQVTDPQGAVTCYDRDYFGRSVSITDSLGNITRLTWSVEGKPLRRIDPDGSQQSWTYDGEGNCLTHTDALDGITYFEYTHFDLLTARTGPDGVRHEFTHDTNLRLTRVTNPQGLNWDYVHDAAGRLTSEADFDGRILSYTHDAAGQLTSRVNGLGQTIRYERDDVGRVVAKDAEGAVTRYEYDAAGRLTRAVGPQAELAYARDRMGRVTSETCNGRTISYAYDELGRRTHRITPTGRTSDWIYSQRRAKLIASGRTLTFEHDQAGRELARHIGETVTLTSTWDGTTGRLTKQLVTGLDDEAIQHRMYTYRADGSLTAIDDQLSGPRRFELDTAGRVTAVQAHNWSERYAYDEAGNQKNASWPSTHVGQEATGTRSYAGSRIVRAGGVRYEHDAQGRIIRRQKTRISRKPDIWQYSWDSEDRLSAVVAPDGAIWHYQYDPLGRRIAKQRLSEDGQKVMEQVDFTWDGSTLCEQTTLTPGAPQAVTLTWDYDGFRPLAQTECKITNETPQREIDGRFFAIVTDLVGTPCELIDEEGVIAWRSRTTLWGVTTWHRTATAYTPLRFPGQYFDPETGLHYNYFRHYDPETARYISRDSLGLNPGPNPATYVGNPHTWSDPLGLFGCPNRKSGGPHSVVLGANYPEPYSNDLARHLRENGDPGAHTYNGNDFAAEANGTPVWMSNVMESVNDRGTALSITMDGMPNSAGVVGNWNTPEGIVEAFQVAAKHGENFGVGPNQVLPSYGSGTAWEMSVVARSVRVFNADPDLGGRAWDSIHWYSGNERVNVPQPNIPQLDPGYRISD